MSLKLLPSECIAYLRLKQIDLHGVGSYLHPASLEIKPITILCGTNGSGKSTWMKALNAVQESLQKYESEQKDNYTSLSAFFARTILDDNLRNAAAGLVEIEDIDPEVGPPSSIGLHFTCVKPFRLPEIDDVELSDESGPLQRELVLKKGDKVFIRLSCFGFLKEEDSSEGPVVLSERLEINNRYSEMILGPLTPDSTANKIIVQSGVCCKKHKPVETKHLSSHEDEVQYVIMLEKRIYKILQVFFRGYFHISAIRTIQDEAPHYGKMVSTIEKIGRTRYVGQHGEYTHDFRLYHSLTPIFDPRSKRPYMISLGHLAPEGGAIPPLPPTEEEERIEKEKLESEKKKLKEEIARSGDNDEASKERLSHLMLLELLTVYAIPNTHSDIQDMNLEMFWRYLYENHREKLEEFARELSAISETENEKLTELILETYRAIGTGNFKNLATLITHSPIGLQGRLARRFEYLLGQLRVIINEELIARPDYYRWFVENLSQYPPFERNFGGHWNAQRDLPWAQFLLSLPENKLHPDDIAFLKNWAECRSVYYYFGGDKGVHAISAYELFTAWSRYIVGVDAHFSAMDDDSDARDIDWTKEPERRVGYLSVFEHDEDYPYAPLQVPDQPYRNALLHNKHVAPKHLSAGFHQVAPVLVQMNMMKLNEVLAIENPEVHLHPGSQLKFASYFVENALIGKYSIIETHSDLFIRRVMRDIANEKIRQEWVNIAFVHIKDFPWGNDTIKSATLKSIKLDERGIVENWPEGFLDDDEKETKALMRTLYGDRLAEEEETDD